MVGKKLSHFEITAPLGKGGMGEVYRAVDSRLEREVAIKVLPPEVVADDERRARFGREAKILASLDHPAIAGIHQLEQEGGVHFLVMELVEGRTLGDHMAQGPLSIEEVCEIGAQMAEALEAAHDRGIVHRDLKPSNVMVTPRGRVKILDFGLAKVFESRSAGREADLSQSPTLADDRTVPGALLGTAAYMSPEQVRGQGVDKRSDVWAFGCVLFELLTGRRAFDGATMADRLAATVGKEPDWTALPGRTPAALRRLLVRCLAKDPERRLRDLGDARLELEDALGGDVQAGETGTASPATGRWAWLGAGVLAGLALGVVAGRELAPGGDSAPGPPAPAIRGAVELPAGAELAYGAALIGFDSPLLAISPDGSSLVYVGGEGDESRLYLHRLTGFGEPRAIAGTDGALHAFFSPDGQAVGFVTKDRLKRVSLDGSDLRTLAEVVTTPRAWWLADGSIVSAEEEGTSVSRLPPGGGPKEALLRLTATVSDVLPDGRLLATSWGGGRGLSFDYADVLLVNAESGAQTVLVQGGYDARYVAGGSLVFARAGSLLAVGFDAASGRVVGEPVTVARGVAMDSLSAQAQFGVSANGTLAFVPGSDRGLGRLVRMNGEGREEPLAAEVKVYGALDLAPDDLRLAVHVGDVADFVWIYDLRREQGRMLQGARPGGWPVWNSSGSALSYARLHEGVHAVMLAEVEGAGAPTELLDLGRLGLFPMGWAPDDRTLVVSGVLPDAFAVLDLDGGSSRSSDLEWTPGWGGVFSPDGRWLAYSGTETGVYEVYVRSWPAGDVVRQISTGGGVEPRWTPSGKLFYRAGDTFWSTVVRTSPELAWDAPRLVLQTDFLDTPGMSFDVSADGEWLYMVKQAEPDRTDRIHVVGGWSAELRERLR